MKKFKLILCLCACVLGLSACNTAEENVLDVETATALESTTQMLVSDFFASLSPADVEELAGYGPEYLEYMFDNYIGIKANGNALVGGLNSWSSAAEVIGQFQQVVGMEAVYDDQGSDIIVTVDILGTNKSAQVEAIYEDNMYHTLTSITTNVNYTFGEKMSKAGLNTLMGMGTVFVVLILISFIISLFKYITKIQDAFSKKDKNAQQTATGADTAIAQIIEKEEQTDDLELIAVITAAIAATGTSGSADDFVVRSIRRKSNSQWNKA